MELLKDNGFALAVIATLVKLLGGSVEITQAQMDELVGVTLTEDVVPGVLTLNIKDKVTLAS